MKKRALIVGINYVGSGHDLRGCINDADNMLAMLQQQGFLDIVVLKEAAATTVGIKLALQNLVNGADAGDVLVFHYSGHGSQLPSKSQPSGYEEIICPYDLDWKNNIVTDAYIKYVFSSCPTGTNTTLILDCCYSGETEVKDAPVVGVPISSVISNGTGSVTVVSQTGSDTVTVNSRFLSPPVDIAALIKNEGMTPVLFSTARNINATAIMISACGSNQTSADAYIGGVYQGAGTYSLIATVAAKTVSSYRDINIGMLDYMVKNGFTQRPELDGADLLKDDTFLQPWPASPVITPVPVTAPVSMPIPVLFIRPTVSNNVGSNPIYLMLLVVAIIAIIFFIVS
jgi:hypothetical protein